MLTTVSSPKLTITHVHCSSHPADHSALQWLSSSEGRAMSRDPHGSVCRNNKPVCNAPQGPTPLSPPPTPCLLACSTAATWAPCCPLHARVAAPTKASVQNVLPPPLLCGPVSLLSCCLHSKPLLVTTVKGGNPQPHAPHHLRSLIFLDRTHCLLT